MKKRFPHFLFFACLRLITSSFFICFFFQNDHAQILLPEADILDTIKCFRSENPAERVKIFQAKMPNVNTDEKLRADVMRKIPAEVQKLQIDDPILTEKFRAIIFPVLKLYNREKVYDVLIFRHPTPVIFSDTGVLLVISTGMIERASSDDELVGYTAHEIGHDFFSGYSIFSKHLLKLIIAGGREQALDRKITQTLALIELQCDAFAAVSVAYLNSNPLSFIEGMEKSAIDFPQHGMGYHPPDAVRRRVVEGVVPQKYLQIRPQVSDKLKELKIYIRNLSGNSDKRIVVQK